MSNENNEDLEELQEDKVDDLENLEENNEIDSETENSKPIAIEKKKVANNNKTSNSSITEQSKNILGKVLILAVISTSLSMITTGVSFAPVFYQLEISASIIMMGGFALGPIAVAYMQLADTLLNFFIFGTDTAGVNELAGFLMGLSYAMTGTIIFHKNGKDFKAAIIGVIAGTVTLGLISGVFNYFILVPVFAEAYHMSIESIVGMGTALNSSITNLEQYILYAVIPFNALKGTINSIITLICYRQLGNIIKKIKY